MTVRPAPRGGMRRGVYPGSFNPPTVAHLAIAEAARRQRQLDEVVWVISEAPLAKEAVDRPLLTHRLDVLEAVASQLGWLRVEVTSAQLLADIADGYDLLVMGADKWEQIQQWHWYGSAEDRDSALARLPDLAVAPRPPIAVPDDLLLDIDVSLANVSSTAARAGFTDHMLPEARRFARRSGAWVEPDRYEAWLRSAE